MVCSHCKISRHLALKNTKHDVMRSIHWEVWSSLAGSAHQVWEAFTFPASVVEPTVARLTSTNFTPLCRTNRTSDLGVMTYLRDHKTADLPLLQGAELTAVCHLLPGSWRSRRRSTIQLVEGGHLLLPPNRGHLPPSRRWRWRRMMMYHSWAFSRRISFFLRNSMFRLASSCNQYLRLLNFFEMNKLKLLQILLLTSVEAFKKDSFSMILSSPLFKLCLFILLVCLFFVFFSTFFLFVWLFIPFSCSIIMWIYHVVDFNVILNELLLLYLQALSHISIF